MNGAFADKQAIPMTVGGQYLVNTEASAGATGYLARMQARPTDWLRVGYQGRYSGEIVSEYRLPTSRGLCRTRQAEVVRGFSP